MREKIPVGILGATGSVGQRFLSLLADHPWFEVAELAASERSAGKQYGDVVRWSLPGGIPKGLESMRVKRSEPLLESRLLFSALDGDIAGPLESAFAEAGHWVVSNAKSHRMDPKVPLIIPEVNPDHLELAATQRSSGAILTNPNCSTIGLILALAPLHRAFGVTKVSVVTLQALSGAGIPGVPSLMALDNIVPFIGGEEDKLEAEGRKILGQLSDGAINPATIVVSAACNRVAVVDGHTECVSVEFAQPVTRDEILETWLNFRGRPQELGLPFAPDPVIRYSDRADRPQPHLDRDAGQGMAVTVGRLRPCPILGWKFVALSHNTIRGAAGGAILVAELAVNQGWLDPQP